MLDYSQAQVLDVAGEVPKKLYSLAFSTDQALWIKDNKHNVCLTSETANKRYRFIKIGKTFGFETTRYLALVGQHLVYYNGEDDEEFLGYCSLQETYVQWISLNSGRSILLICNGSDKVSLYFENDGVWRDLRPKIACNIVQIDFKSNYHLGKEIGQGSFSKVYLVVRRDSGKQYAAKIINKKDQHKVCTKSIVLQEKRILSLLHSQYVYSFEEFYEEEDYFIFVLEYVPGCDLMTHFKNKTEFQTTQVIRIFHDILKGLAECHEVGVIHRDLKPQNIILSLGQYKPKLIDFGLSFRADKGTDLKNYKRCGTMGYMAPEVIANSSDQRKPYTSKCDIFSFGIIAHMVLLGFNPLKGKNYEETYTKNKECTIELNKEDIISKYGPPCFVFLSKLLSTNWRWRYSATEALQSQFLTDKASNYKQQSNSTVDDRKHHKTWKFAEEIIDAKDD